MACAGQHVGCICRCAFLGCIVLRESGAEEQEQLRTPSEVDVIASQVIAAKATARTWGTRVGELYNLTP